MLDGIFSKICLVMAFLMMLMGIEIYIQHLKIVNYETKQASVAQIGKVQEYLTTEKNTHSKESKGVAEEEYAKVITSMHTDLERLRKQVTSGSKLPRTPQICTSASETTEVNWPDVDQAIRDYRQEVAGLVGEGSEAEAALNAIKLWVEKETLEG